MKIFARNRQPSAQSQVVRSATRDTSTNNDPSFSHAVGPGVSPGPHGSVRRGSLLERWLATHRNMRTIAGKLGMVPTIHLPRRSDSSDNAAGFLKHLRTNVELFDRLTAKQREAVVRSLRDPANDAILTDKKFLCQLSAKLLSTDPRLFDEVIGACLDRGEPRHIELLGHVIGHLPTQDDMTTGATRDYALRASMSELRKRFERDHSSLNGSDIDVSVLYNANLLVHMWRLHTRNDPRKVGNDGAHTDIADAISDWKDIVKYFEFHAWQRRMEFHRLPPSLSADMNMARDLIGYLHDMALLDKTKDFPRVETDEAPWRAVDCVHDRRSWNQCWNTLQAWAQKGDDGMIDKEECDATIDRFVDHLEALLHTRDTVRQFEDDIPGKLEKLLGVIGRNVKFQISKSELLYRCLASAMMTWKPETLEKVLPMLEHGAHYVAMREVLQVAMHRANELSDGILETLGNSAQKAGLLPKNIDSALTLIKLFSAKQRSDHKNLFYFLCVTQGRFDTMHDTARELLSAQKSVGFGDLVYYFSRAGTPRSQVEHILLDQLDHPGCKQYLLDLLPVNAEAALEAIRILAPGATLKDMLKAVSHEGVGRQKLNGAGLMPYLQKIGNPAAHSNLATPMAACRLQDVSRRPTPNQVLRLLAALDKAGLLPKNATQAFLALKSIRSLQNNISFAGFLWSLPASRLDAAATVTAGDIVAYLRSIDRHAPRKTAALQYVFKHILDEQVLKNMPRNMERIMTLARLFEPQASVAHAVLHFDARRFDGKPLDGRHVRDYLVSVDSKHSAPFRDFRETIVSAVDKRLRAELGSAADLMTPEAYAEQRDRAVLACFSDAQLLPKNFEAAWDKHANKIDRLFSLDWEQLNPQVALPTNGGGERPQRRRAAPPPALTLP